MQGLNRQTSELPEHVDSFQTNVLVIVYVCCASASDEFLDNVINSEGPYKFKDLDYRSYKLWPKLDIIDKLYILMKKFDIDLLYIEYQRYLEFSNATDFSFEVAEAFQSDFNHLDEIKLFFKECDKDLDYSISFTEYVICRGDFDQSGNAVAINEYEARANSFIHEYENYLRSGKKLYDVYVYDEDGIIIDEIHKDL